MKIQKKVQTRAIFLMSLLALASTANAATAKSSTATPFVAKNFELSVDVSLNGEASKGAVVAVKQGATAQIIKALEEGNAYVDLISIADSETMDNAVEMKFVVGMLEKNGEKTVLSKPEVVSLKNEPAQITVGDSNGKERLSLSVKATEASN